WWWVENLPFLDTPEDNIDKTLYYRWWLLRYNYLDANIPGNDYQFPTSMEGVLGYNNAIVLTTGMFIDDLKYFRNPVYSYGPVLSAGQVAKSSRYIDNPGYPAHWGASFTQYITEAAWRAYELHGGPSTIGATLGLAGENDVKGLLATYDSNNNNLVEFNYTSMTGNDADAVSFYFRTGSGSVQNMDRTESAYLYSNAVAAANFYRLAGNTAKATEMDNLAASIKQAVLDVLWEDARSDPDEVGLYGNLLKHHFTSDGYANPYKEINNYYPYAVGLMPQPGDADYDAKYLEALRLWADADQYPIFPFYTANQVDNLARIAAGNAGSNNFSIINSTVTFRLLTSALRNYPTSYITADDYKKLLYWNAWAHYQGGDNRQPNQNEFWSNGSAAAGGSIGYRSWIQHTILGTTNWTVIEDAMGFRPREDAKIELDPIDIGWDHFAANNLSVHGYNLQIIWDQTGTNYASQVPAGYSLWINGQLAFTVDKLTHVIYDPATGTVQLPDNPAAGATVVTNNIRSFQSASQVRFADSSRVVDAFQKAGTDITTGSWVNQNFAKGKTVTASYSASGRAAANAVDGSTVNEPFWGTAGSANATDTLTVNFGSATLINTVRTYYYNTSSTATVSGYAPPRLYQLEYWTGTAWQVIPDQNRTPAAPQGNYNLAKFPAVTTTQIRLTVSHAQGYKTGLKEIQAFYNPASVPTPTNVAPKVRASVDPAYVQPAQARLVGTVGDDALPSGVLTTQWSLVSGPTGGGVIFLDPAQATTVAQFTVSGHYVLKLEASDGALTSSQQVELDITVTAGAKPNIAPSATATASAVTTWNLTAALNDGYTTYPAGAEANAWGTWHTTPSTGGEWWVQLTWPYTVRVDETSILWHDDCGTSCSTKTDGVAPPASWHMQYLNSSGVWVDIPNPSTYGVARGVFNDVTFDPVFTTAVRAWMGQSATGSNYPGIIEWEVYGLDPTAVESPAVRTVTGTAPVLPATVEAVWDDNARLDLPVTWQTVEPSSYAAAGQFTVLGFVQGTSLIASATVYVRDTPGTAINNFVDGAVGTNQYVAPNLPERAIANYNDGTSESLAVVWDAIPAAQYAVAGTFDVYGTVAGTTVRPKCVVTVASAPASPPVVSLSVSPTTPASGWYGTSPTVTVNVTDLADPSPTVEYAVDGGAWTPYTAPFTLSGTGTHAVQARATNLFALVSAVANATIKLDTTAPTASALFDNDYRLLTVTGADADSGLAGLQYRIGTSGTWLTYRGAVVVNATGTVQYRSLDAAGNYSAIGSVSVPAPTDPDKDNLAPDADPTATACTTWNCSSGIPIGINDLNDPFPVGSNYTQSWGVWGDSNANPTATATLTWATPITTDLSQVLFDDDSGGSNPSHTGLLLPASWKIEYYNLSTSAWTEIPNHSTYTTTYGQYDTVTHDPITTTAMRITLTKPATAYMGVVEWKVFSAVAPIVPVTPGTPSISGTVQVDQTVTALPGTWTPSDTTLAYQWELDGVAVAGATAVTYTLQAADAGKTLTVVVTGSKTGYASASATSAGAVVAPPSPMVPGTPSISGTVQVGETVTAMPGSWTPSDATFTYQWQLDGVAVSGATAASYVIQPADLDKTLTVQVTGAKPTYATTSAVSAGAVVAQGTITLVAQPSILGTVQVGSTVSATPGTWSVTSLIPAYQWQLDGTPITGATAVAYTIQPSDNGHYLRVVVTVTKAGYASANAPSASQTVLDGTITPGTVTITGTVESGQTVSAAPGTWSPAGVTLTYQWLRNGTPISGATSVNYVVKPADVGFTLTVKVTGTLTGYTTATATSAGQLVPPIVVPPPTHRYESFTLTPDLSGDGKGEILAVATSGGALHQYHVGADLKSLGSAVTLVSSGLNGSKVFGPGDWDADGLADVITVDASGVMWLWKGKTGNKLAAKVQNGKGWSAYRIIPSGDLDGDKFNDLLAIDTAGKLWLYSGNGKGGFKTERKEVGHGWTGFQCFGAGDLNNDKKMDILGISSTGLLYAYFGKGNGTFQAPVQVGKGWGAFTLAAGADLNGDALADIVGRNDTTGQLYFYKSKGGGQFAAASLLNSGGPVW
ncbi:MAG: Ig-like domain-containing protein, partial [Bifidobacteriaceae bacterium]|nr:Ig-like domain-containing protein [Bifidobacteriaceae bacterium]